MTALQSGSVCYLNTHSPEFAEAVQNHFLFSPGFLAIHYSRQGGNRDEYVVYNWEEVRRLVVGLRPATILRFKFTPIEIVEGLSSVRLLEPFWHNSADISILESGGNWISHPDDIFAELRRRKGEHVRLIPTPNWDTVSLYGLVPQPDGELCFGNY